MFDQIKEKLKSAGKRAEEAGQWLMVIEPVPPFNSKGMVTALITAASMISVTLLAGVGLATLLILLLSLGMILLILTQIFGIEFDVDPNDFMRF